MGIPGKVGRWVSGWEGGMSRYVRGVLVVCCYRHIDEVWAFLGKVDRWVKIVLGLERGIVLLLTHRWSVDVVILIGESSAVFTVCMVVLSHVCTSVLSYLCISVIIDCTCLNHGSGEHYWCMHSYCLYQRHRLLLL